MGDVYQYSETVMSMVEVWFVYEDEDARLAKKAKGEIIDNCTKKVFKALRTHRSW